MGNNNIDGDCKSFFLNFQFEFGDQHVDEDFSYIKENIFIP